MEISTVEISKIFGSVEALNKVDFRCKEGQIHGLLGENGAGKTTLMNIVYGLYQPTSGEVRINNVAVKLHSPADAIRHGIGMVHQQSTLVAEFNAFENIILGSKNKQLKDTEETKKRISSLSETYGMEFPLYTEVGLLEIGVRQKIEIIRAIFRGAKTLILDEPTTTLTEKEFEQLKQSLVKLAKQGMTIILITHKIREVFGICDQITILRNGKLQGTLDVKKATQEECIKMMFGDQEINVNSSALPVVQYKPAKHSDSPKIVISKLHSKSSQYSPGVVDSNLEVFGGEILGIAGISGNGQKELVDAIFNPDTWISGDIQIEGNSIKNLTTEEVFSLGVSYTPEDRIKEGILPHQSLTKNVLLHHYANKDFQRNGFFVNWDSVSQATNWVIREFKVSTPGEKIEIQRLSGGNIQKMMLGRALISKAKVLVVHNPTFGIDVSTVDFIFKKLISIRDDGGAVIFVNEDLDELIDICDRIAVMYNGRIVSTLTRDKFDKFVIGSLMIKGAE